MTEIVAYCRLTLDGMIVLAESTFTLAPEVKQPPNSYTWQFPIGMGSMHSVGVYVTFSERKR
jgi:hypothetical protein